MKQLMHKSLLKSQSGLITIDFIFASILVGGFFAILFSLMLTLSVVEVTQYITFATARVYHGGHWSKEKQEELANTKFQQLIEDPVVAPLFKNGWFELTGGPGIQDWNELYQQTEEDDSGNFIGSRVQLAAKIMEFRIPLIGETSDLENAFSANVASYLNREPTSMECYEFMSAENRFEAIKNLDATYRNSNVRDYVVMEDNGC